MAKLFPCKQYDFLKSYPCIVVSSLHITQIIINRFNHVQKCLPITYVFSYMDCFRAVILFWHEVLYGLLHLTTFHQMLSFIELTYLLKYPREFFSLELVWYLANKSTQRTNSLGLGKLDKIVCARGFIILRLKLQTRCCNNLINESHFIHPSRYHTLQVLVSRHGQPRFGPSIR